MDVKQKRNLFIESFIKFAEVFCETEYGYGEVDIASIVEYVESPRFTMIDAWEVQSIDDCYRLIENMILNGVPIWSFLKISDWSKKIMSQEFSEFVQKEKEEMASTFKCLQDCAFYIEEYTQLGTIRKCTYKENSGKTHSSFRLGGGFNPREKFKLKKECGYFQKK